MKKILVIEDHAPMRSSLTKTLERGGYHVYPAPDGLTGINLASQHQPDLVLCDVLLPRMNGYEVFTSVRQNTATAKIPFVFMTGNSLTGSNEPMSRNRSYLLKPFEPNQLLEMVKYKLEEREPGNDQEQLEHLEALEHILRTISHEMRNPICSSLGLASLLEANLNKKNNDDEVRRIIGGIKANAAKLDSITVNLTNTVYQAAERFRKTGEKRD